MRIEEIKESRRPVRTVLNDVVLYELKDSMERSGQLSPILIRDNYVVDGHRRLRAAKMLAWDEILVTERNFDRKDELIAMIRLNDLTIAENRRAILRLSSDFQLDKLTNVGYSLGRNIDWVAEVLGLRSLSPIVRKSVDNGMITIQVAMLLAKLPKGRQRELLTDSIKIPVSELVPKLQQEVRHRYEEKLDRRTSKRGRPDTPWLRSESEILDEALNPTEAMRLITKYNANSPFEGWSLALRWALRQDPESLSTRTLNLEPLNEQIEDGS